MEEKEKGEKGRVAIKINALNNLDVMEKLIALLQDKLEPLCQKLQTQVFLRAIHDSFLGMAPISFVSAIALIVKQFIAYKSRKVLVVLQRNRKRGADDPRT